MELLQSFFQEHAQNFLDHAVGTLPVVAAIIIATMVLSRISQSLISGSGSMLLKKMEKNGDLEDKEGGKRLHTLIGILRSSVKIIIWAMAIMIVLMEMGIDIAPIIAGAGIVGLALGFGSQELVRDFISGFFILLENHIRTGDVAVINGTGGLVEQVGLRTIVMRDVSGVVHIFQNGKIDTLSNMTKEWSALIVTIGVAYKEDTDHVFSVLDRVGTELFEDEVFSEKILEPIEIMGVDGFGDNSVDIKVKIKTQPIEQWACAREYRRRVKKAFDAENIEIPFPHRTIYWGSDLESLKISTTES
jgi:small conductance mechanosensitive channel